MNNFLGWLRISMMISGIIAELIPAIASELPKRKKKTLIVTKVPIDPDASEDDDPKTASPPSAGRPIAAGEDRFLKDEPNLDS